MIFQGKEFKVKLDRPIQIVDNLRRMRHNINYYGFNPKNLLIDDNYLNKMVVIEFILNKPKYETATLPFVRGAEAS